MGTVVQLKPFFICSGCGIAKDVSNFAPRKDLLRGHGKRCHSCGNRRLAGAKEKNDAARNELISADATKVCRVCRENKKIIDFTRDQLRADGTANLCKKCAAASMLNWRRKNPDKALEKDRRGHLRRQYGLTQEAMSHMRRAQNNKCAICSSLLMDNKGRQIGIVIDHDHKSGAIRGLLCSRCNTGLGSFKEDVRALRNAIAYLCRHKGEK